MSILEWAWTMVGYFGPLLVIGVIGTSLEIYDLLKSRQKHTLFRVRDFRP